MTIDFAGATDPETEKYNREFKATVTWTDSEIDPSTRISDAGAAFKNCINDYAAGVIHIEEVENIEEL